jgi:DNA repair exonuclease SbcCD ATPase subunit
MMRGAAEAFGVALQAIGGALVDAATAPDAQEEMRREIDALRAELREADAQAEALRDELSTTNVRLEGIISDRDRAFLDISREYQLRKQVVADLEAMRATLTQRERELADYDVALGKAQQELQECRQELNSEKRHATSVFAQLGNADAELETTRGACDSLAIGLAEKQDELESMQRQRDAFAHDLTAVVQREVEAQNRAFKAGWEDADECIRRENWIVPRTAEVVRVSASYVAYQQDEWDDFPAVEYAQFVRLPEPPEVSHG